LIGLTGKGSKSLTATAPFLDPNREPDLPKIALPFRDEPGIRESNHILASSLWIECPKFELSDGFNERLKIRFVKEEASFFFNDSLRSSPFSERNNRTAARLSLDRDETEIFEARENQSPGPAEKFANPLI